MEFLLNLYTVLMGLLVLIKILDIISAKIVIKMIILDVERRIPISEQELSELKEILNRSTPEQLLEFRKDIENLEIF